MSLTSREELDWAITQQTVRDQATEIDRLRTLLAPFAKGASAIPDNWPDHRALLIDEKHPDNPKKHCLLIAFVKDFRAARDGVVQQQQDRP